MKFAELDDRAKERVREKLRAGQCQDNWWEYVYEDANEYAKCLGIEIGLRGYSTAKGKRHEELDICFQLNHSQGDGCCFSGWFELADMAGAVEKVKQHAPRDEELASLAAEAERLFGSVATERMRRRTLDLDDVLGSRVTIVSRDSTFSTRVDDDELEQELPELADEFTELASNFAHWIYKQLEKEADYQMSDEVIDALAEDDDFDEFGNS